MAITAPKHLSRSSKALFRRIVADYGLDVEPHAREVLRLGLEALDRAAEARAAIDSAGLFYTDRHGTPRAHPGVAVERDSRLAAVRCFRELSLDAEAPDEPRVPRVGGGRS